MTTPQEYGLTQVAYSISDTGKVLGIGRTAVYDLIRAGHLNPMKPLAKKNIILAIEIAALLDMWRAAPAKQHLVKRRKAVVLEKKAEEQRAKGRELAPENAALLADLGL
jgi:hypothetical protein